MKAALLLRPGEMVVGDVPDPEPGPDDVRIAVGGVGLCGSDLALFRGTWTPPQYPWIQGHEAFGTVEAVGERVPLARIGEAVVIEPNVPCVDCAQCAARPDLRLRQPPVRGDEPAGRARRAAGGPERQRVGHPRAAERDLACVEPLAVVEAALRRLGGRRPGGARDRRRIPGPPDAPLARRAGHGGARPRRQPGPGRPRVRARRARAARGRGRAESTSSSTRWARRRRSTLALRHAAIGGTILVLGLDATPFELTAQTLVRRQLMIRGSLTYDHPGDFAATVARVRSGAHRRRAG